MAKKLSAGTSLEDRLGHGHSLRRRLVRFRFISDIVISIMLRVDDRIPNVVFSIQGRETTLYEFAGNEWLLLITHKAFLNPVFATEVHALIRARREFDKRHVKLLAIVPDTEVHLAKLSKDLDLIFEDAHDINFDIIADEYGEISKQMLLLRREASSLKGHPLRRKASSLMTPSVIIVDSFRRVRWRAQFPATVGRNVPEMIRCVDALRVTSSHEIECPSNWANGEDVFVSDAVEDDDARASFPRGVVFVKPWLRLTPIPGE